MPIEADFILLVKSAAEFPLAWAIALYQSSLGKAVSTDYLELYSPSPVLPTPGQYSDLLTRVFEVELCWFLVPAPVSLLPRPQKACAKGGSGK